MLSRIINHDDDDDDSQQDSLHQLQQDIAKCNQGKPLNVNSHKQVSMAIFGNIQSTSRQALINATQGEGVDSPRQQTLAKLVLQHRALTSQYNKQQQQQSAFSTLAKSTSHHKETTPMRLQQDVNENVEKAPARNNNQVQGDEGSHYEQWVESLFQKTSKLNHFWKHALLQVTKPSARNMVLQLNTATCPMGYNPAALPGAAAAAAGLRSPRNTSAATVVSLSTSEQQAGKKGSLLHYVRLQKKKYSDCIILTRVGEFYETYGMDAVLLVEVRL